MNLAALPDRQPTQPPETGDLPTVTAEEALEAVIAVLQPKSTHKAFGFDRAAWADLIMDHIGTAPEYQMRALLTEDPASLSVARSERNRFITYIANKQLAKMAALGELE